MLTTNQKTGKKKKRATYSTAHPALPCCCHFSLFSHEGVFSHLLQRAVAAVVADDRLTPFPHLLPEDLGGGGGVPVVQVRDAVRGDEHHLSLANLALDLLVEAQQQLATVVRRETEHAEFVGQVPLRQNKEHINLI